MNYAQKHFNTAGPIIPDIHYHIAPLKRFNLEEIELLIDSQKYFILHAPRQTGKTTFMLALMDHLNKQGKYKSLYINVERAQAARENIRKAMISILNELNRSASIYLKDTFFKKKYEEILQKEIELDHLNEALTEWSQQSEKPIVLFIDEIDSLVGDSLISVLRQLRSGYASRPGNFPQSIILCGVRDVRDYRIHSDKEKTIITGGSAFNIKAKSLRLGNFTQDEIKELYLEHTAETGQTFNEDVFPLVWSLTEGQPWLVNALGDEVCFEMKEGKDRSREITPALINRAKEKLILERQTHLDQLSDKLKEERVRRVIEPILVGSEESEKIPDDDIDYLIDLGLIKKDRSIRIANRIYQEVIPRAITYSTQLTLTQESCWYLNEDGSIDMNKLLIAFQDFFRKHFEHWVDGFDYAEAGPQLLLQAFLQRVVNGGGRVEREYGLGRMRTDLLVIWPFKNSVQQAVVELKLIYGSKETTIEKGLEQTSKYMDKCGTTEGYLIIINRDKKSSWEERIFKEERIFNNTKITVFGM